ncbi:MAG TPA: YciI-like protein [Steroidobacteraceae bacterium]|nr:YciI-like protein [Steroidobacteraceae bacterium]
MHFLLLYDFVPDYLQHRPPHRSEHLRLAWEAHRRGELVLAGALADPVDGAVLWFQGENDQAARAFAESDPYVKAGLVRHWSVRAWTTVVGEMAVTPVRPPA